VGILIDSSVVIAAERSDLDLDAVLVRPGGDEALGVAAITVAEVLYGVHRLSGLRRLRAHQFADRWLRVLPVIAFDVETATVHATLAVDLGRAGLPMGAHDLIVAATAVRLGYAVATRDRRSFGRIEGLDVEYW
jgi:predicted nucleic acid-binding protein